jgi:hypothetical protein
MERVKPKARVVGFEPTKLLSRMIILQNGFEPVWVLIPTRSIMRLESHFDVSPEEIENLKSDEPINLFSTA